MVCSLGESFTHRINRIKVFKPITAGTALIACCIGNPIPAEARNGWIYVTEGTNGRSHYIRNARNMGGGVYRYENNLNHIKEAKCNGSYIYTRTYELNIPGHTNPSISNGQLSGSWDEPRPGTIGMALAEAACGLR